MVERGDSIDKKLFFGSTLVLFGPGKIAETAAALAGITDRRAGVLVVHDPGSWLEPVLQDLLENLKAHGFSRVKLFSGLSPNPRLVECDEGQKCARDGDCRLIIALGGGSVIDGAKRIAREAGGEIMVAIPTTAGTGSYINEWSVLLDQENCRISIPCRSPDLAVVDPVLTVSKSPALTLFTAVDCFAHGLESYLGQKEVNEARDSALQGCKMVVQNLEPVLENGRDLQARSKLFWADLLTGEAMRLTGLGLIHCIANILPALYPQYSHGQICGALMTAVYSFNAEGVDPDRREKIGPVLEQMDKLFQQYMQQLKVPPLIIRDEDVEKIKELAAANINGANNPLPVTVEAVQEVMEQVFLVERG